jgi:hypothetical protein
MDNEATAPVQHRAEIIKCPADVEVTDINAAILGE